MEEKGRSEKERKKETNVTFTERNEHKKITKSGWEYGNERYCTISGIFPLQHECKISACAHLTMHCEEMAVTDMSFRHRAVIEFLVKELNSVGVVYERLHGVYVCRQCQNVGETF
jgi:hypothetical protein